MNCYGTEIWKDVCGYEGIYQISNFGNVRKLKYYAGNQFVGHQYKDTIINMKSYIDDKGYPRIALRYCGKTKQCRIHRLVAQAFLPNPNNLPEVNHKDENKLNNHVDNLEWCTHIYNTLYGTRVERIVQTNLMRHRRMKSVLQYDLDGTFIREWESISCAGRVLGLSAGNISSCCSGVYKTSGGFIWRYKEQ